MIGYEKYIVVLLQSTQYSFILDEFPWQISLQVMRGGDWGHNCGGSIVDETTVVTAAHCCYGQSVSGMQVMIDFHSYSRKWLNSPV